MKRWLNRCIFQLLCQFAAIAIAQYPAVVLAATDLELPPIRWWGELGYDFRLEQFEEGDDLTENAGIFRLNASSFLYQPWLATLEAGVGFNLRRTDVGDSTIDNESIVGNGTLRVFPQSRFPFEGFFERSDSRTDTDLAGFDLERTRYGFLQRYTTTQGAAYRLGYEHSELSNDVSGIAGRAQDTRDVSDLVRLGFNKAFGAHAINFDANVNEVDRADSPDFRRTAFSTLRHSYRPGPALSAEDMLSYNLSDVRQGAADFETRVLQLNSFAFWRPKTQRPLRVNATLRALGRTNESGSSEASAHTATSTLGASYEWSPRWVFNVSAGVTGTETETDDEVQSFQNANAIYTSKIYKLRGFDATWFGQLDVRNNTDEEGAIQSAGVETGYSLGRSILLTEQSQFRSDLRQSISFVEDTEDFSAQTLLSNLSLSWNRRAGATSSLLRLSGSDSRTWAGNDDPRDVEGNFQIINFQASLDRQLSATSVVSGNMTLQATRDYQPRLNGVADTTNGEWTPTATMDLTYFKRHLFGVPRLSFRSTARFVSDSYVPLLDETRTENGRDDKQWENRLEYSIGRLQLRAIARVSQIRDMEQSFLLFQVRRMFGDL